MRAFLTKLRFARGYLSAFRQSHSHAEAIHTGLTKLAERKPFDILTPADIKRIVPVWSLIPDPRIVADLVANCVRKNNVGAMKDKWFLDQLAAKYREVNRKQASKESSKS